MEGPPSDWPCLVKHSEGVALKLKVSPHASRTRAGGLWQDRLRLRVQAPPVEGKANRAVLRWAARVFGVRNQDVRLLQGERGSSKLLLITGLELGAARSVLKRKVSGTADS